MDSGTISGIITAIFVAVFIGIVWWAFSKRNKERFEEDAQLPFQDDDDTPGKRGDKQ
ncbi:MAG: cbb3-type cytochrome c oxidase subunit 3 [Betaproteobacteria bacterium]|nr:cbb3-type cytochrome c oxidase subunit 3 [Betaproteobacteria bacterium]